MIEPGIQSIWQAFAATAGLYPERPVFNVMAETAEIYGIAPGETSYREVCNQVTQLAAALQQKGYGPGFRVMLLLENRPEFFVWLLALNRIGASVVPVNPDLRHSELTYMAGHSEPSLIVGIAARCDGLAAAAQEAGLTVPVIAPGDLVPQPGTAGPVALRVSEADGGLDGEAMEAALLYTSGTTGNPKGCILTNTYFLESGRWYAKAGGLCALNEDGERMITPLPIFHMNAMAYSFMAMIAVGGCLTVLDRFHPSSWWKSVSESGATCLHYLGVMPSMLMGAPESPADRDHSVRFGFGAGVDPKLHARFEDRFGFPLVEAWAMTETGAGAVICANQLPRRVGESCLGKPGDELDVRIMDSDGAETRNGPGELLVRRKGDEPQRGFFSGYFKNGQATEEAWADGWFHTGDIVRREDDGSMFFVDRKKNVIRRSGENIAAVEVESALMRHPAVKAAAVAAVADPVRGDEVFACLKVEGDAGPELAGEIVSWCLEQLAYYKAPGYVAFVDALPLTSTQKIQRRELKELAERLVQDAATVDTRAMKKRTAA
ncbi:MAG: AMP-binding protein [Hoeflea sp.]|uniref:AMP-binding protein n=1 Tax=Hoeflea sp. TaxID=1940281 RepID=UPI003EF915AE